MYKNSISNIFNQHVPIKRNYILDLKLPSCWKSFTKPSRRHQNLEIYSWNVKPILIYKTRACKEISVKILELKSTKKSYFENLDAYKITDNRSFWKTFLPLFTQNSSSGEKLNLVDDGKISSDEKLCETFNQFFSNVVSSLKLM